MNNIDIFIQKANNRNKILTEELQNLRKDLLSVYNDKSNEAGVINPGYYSYFLPVLNSYSKLNIIKTFNVTEDQYTDSFSGKTFKIPIVDVSTNSGKTYRIFVI